MEIDSPNIEFKEKSLSQVILIGGTPVNTDRECSDEEYSHNLHEINRLIQRRIPIHTLYLNYSAKDSFQQIATQTGGRSEQLNMFSSHGAELLTQFVTEEVLRKAAGTQGDAAVQLYQTSYVK